MLPLQAAAILFECFMIDNIINILKNRHYLAIAVFYTSVMTFVYAVFTNMFIGFFTSACPICAPLLVSLLGLSAPLAFILGRNLLLEIASILLLLFALYKLSDSMDKCPA